MPRQFLLNPDGTIPEGVNVAILEREGIPLVWPTESPLIEAGYTVVEYEPVFNGTIWLQVWGIIKLPEPDPEPETSEEIIEPEDRDLTPSQFAYLLALTGLEDIWEVLETRVKPVSLELYAKLKGSRARDTFRFAVTLGMIEQFRPFLPEGFSLTRETLKPLWLKAADF